VVVRDAGSSSNVRTQIFVTNEPDLLRIAIKLCFLGKINKCIRVGHVRHMHSPHPTSLSVNVPLSYHQPFAYLYKMPRIMMIEEQTKKKSRCKRLCRWISIPFRRRPRSYIDTVPDEEARKESKQPHVDISARGYQNTRNSNPVVHNNPYELLKNERHAKNRYRNERPQPPIVVDCARRPPATWDEELDRAIARSKNITMRDKLQSPDLEPPQQGRNRRRSITEKNMDLLVRLHELPAPQISQPPLTRASLEMAAGGRRRSTDSYYFDDWFSDAPTLPVRRPSNSFHDAASDAKKQRKDDRRPSRRRSTSSSRNKPDPHQRPPSGLSGSTQAATQRPQPRHPANNNIALPRTRPNTVPLRNNPSKVLVHSKSRGYKIVRNLLSLDGMRDEAEEQSVEPRHIASIERMADEDRRASRELAS
jgi:hypothetical protein